MLKRRNKQLIALATSLSMIIGGMQGVGAQAAKKASVKLNKTKVTLVKGKKVTLKVKKTNVKKIKSTKWATNKKNIAAVSKKGVVTAKKKGTAKITCTVKYQAKGAKKVVTKKLTCKVTIKNKAVSATTAPTATTPASGPSTTTPATQVPNTQAPGGNETPAPGGDNTPAPGGNETPAPGGDETPAPGGDETPAPGGDETPAPGGDETPAPGGNETPAPGQTPTEPSTGGATSGSGVTTGSGVTEEPKYSFDAKLYLNATEKAQAQLTDSGEISYELEQVNITELQTFYVVIENIYAENAAVDASGITIDSIELLFKGEAVTVDVSKVKSFVDDSDNKNHQICIYNKYNSALANNSPIDATAFTGEGSLSVKITVSGITQEDPDTPDDPDDNEAIEIEPSDFEAGEGEESELKAGETYTFTFTNDGNKAIKGGKIVLPGVTSANFDTMKALLETATTTVVVKKANGDVMENTGLRLELPTTAPEENASAYATLSGVDEDNPLTDAATIVVTIEIPAATNPDQGGEG